MFNSSLDWEGDKVALYNSFDNNVIFIDKKLKELLDNKREKLDELSEIHPTFYESLKANHFIVEDSADEVAEVKRTVNRVDNNQKIFLLTVNPTMNCNFKCWYCYEGHVKQSKMDEQTLESIKKFITKTCGNMEIKRFSLAFFGGEPLIYFKQTVVPLIDYYIAACKDNDMKPMVSFTTNGYLITDEMIYFFVKHNIKPSFQITLDGHREEHNKVRFAGKDTGSYDTIVENIKKLIAAGFFVRARINFTDKNIDSCFRIMDDFIDVPQEQKDINLIFDFHRVWQNDADDNTVDVMESIGQKMKSKGFTVEVRSTTNNVIRSCYADKLNSAVVNFNGDIYKCTARDFTHENSAGHISADGNLIWEEGYVEKRMNSKFKNKPCLTCRILPLCNGGCSQHAIEAKDDYCVFFKEDIDRIVRTKVEEILDANNKAQ